MRHISELDLSEFNEGGLIFDWDGTLADTMWIYDGSDQQVIKKYSGIDVELDEIAQMRDYYLAHTTDTNTYLGWAAEVAKKFQINKSPQELLKQRLEIIKTALREIDYKPDAANFIKAYRVNYLGKMAIATSSTGEAIEVYRDQNQKIRSSAHIDQFFDPIYCVKDILRPKPDPEIYLKVLKKWGVDAGNCLAFEDSLHGVVSAKSAGLKVVNMVDAVQHYDQQKIDELCDFKASSWTELLSSCIRR